MTEELLLSCPVQRSHRAVKEKPVSPSAQHRLNRGDENNTWQYRQESQPYTTRQPSLQPQAPHPPKSIRTVSDIICHAQTESEISNEEVEVLEEESLYERISALKDMIPPSARRTVTNSVSSLTSFGKASLSFSGKALWVISTSAFLIGVPWALAYAEEEQYIQMEREQGMIKGANEVCFFDLESFFLNFLGLGH